MYGWIAFISFIIGLVLIVVAIALGSKATTGAKIALYTTGGVLVLIAFIFWMIDVSVSPPEFYAEPVYYVPERRVSYVQNP